MPDFLDEPQAVELTGLTTALQETFSAQQTTLDDIRRELMKQNPEVLAITRVQGTNTIASGDTSNYRAYFEVGGKSVTAYLLVIYSTFTGSVAISLNSMGNINDGIVFAAGDVLVLPVAVDSINIMTDGTAACPVNNSADTVNGGLVINAFTIPDYERKRFNGPVP